MVDHKAAAITAKKIGTKAIEPMTGKDVYAKGDGRVALGRSVPFKQTAVAIDNLTKRPLPQWDSNSVTDSANCQPSWVELSVAS